MKHAHVTSMLCLAIVLILSCHGCGGEGGGGDGPSTDADLTVDPTVDPGVDPGGDLPGDPGTDAAVGALITAAAGGTVTAPDGLMTLEIPAGALAEDTVISISIVPSSEWPTEVAETEPVTAVYDLQPDGLEFSSPATMTVEIGAEVVATLVEDEQYPMLTGLSWSSEGAIEPLATSEVAYDRGDGTATFTAEVDHLSWKWGSKNVRNGSIWLKLDFGPRDRYYQGEWWWGTAVAYNRTSGRALNSQFDAWGNPPVHEGRNPPPPSGNVEPGGEVAMSPRAHWFCHIPGSGGEAVVDFTAYIEIPGYLGGRSLYVAQPIECLAWPPALCGEDAVVDDITPIYRKNTAGGALWADLEAFNGCMLLMMEHGADFDRIMGVRMGLVEKDLPVPFELSVNAAGDPGDGRSSSARLSALGNRGAFRSTSDNLLPESPVDSYEVFIFDVDPETGDTTVVRRFDEDDDYTDAPAVSGDGRWVLARRDSTHLGVVDMEADPPAPPAMILPDVDDWDNFQCAGPVISHYGRYVAFNTLDQLVAEDTNTARDVYVLDRDSDGDRVYDEPGTEEYVRVSVATDGTEADAESLSPVISADGRVVVFFSRATNLVETDERGFPQIYMRNRDADDNGILDEPDGVETTMVSVSTAGVAAQYGVSAPWPSASLSEDGRWVVFEAGYADLVPPIDTSLPTQVYVHDNVTGETALVSRTAEGVACNGVHNGIISPRGRTIAFGCRNSLTDNPDDTIYLAPNPLDEEEEE